MDEQQSVSAKVIDEVSNSSTTSLGQNFSQNQLNIQQSTAIFSALNLVNDIVIICNAHSEITYINKKAEQLLCKNKDNIIGSNFEHIFTIYNKDNMPCYISPVQICLNNKKLVSQKSDAKLLMSDGNQILIGYSAKPIFTNNLITSVVIVIEDKTHNHIARRQLEYIVQHDPLTNLYNRNYFECQLNHAISISKRDTRTQAMLYVDINKFKVINDTAGHTIGDEILCEVANLLLMRIRECDVLARLGSDDFGILLHDVDSLGAVHIADELITAISALNFYRNNHYYEINISIGVTLLDGEVSSKEIALRQADIACCIAKQQGHGSCHLYSDLDSEDIFIRDELYVVNELQTIISENRFEMFFQPIVSSSTGEILLHETLLRIVDEDKTVRLSTSFIETAERFSMMPKIDRWVIESTLHNIKYLSSKYGDLTVSMNLSAVSISNHDLLKDIKHLILSSGINPTQIVFEITESSAISQIESARLFIKELKEIGCKFALDDFGTGFSSFAYLKYLPVDYIKIDGTFILDIINDKVDQAMVSSIHHIAKSLNIKTIAEYVENKETLELLSLMGIDYVQGNYIGKAAADIYQL